MDRARRLIPGLWAGVLLCIALIATPAAFATLASHEAGRLVGRIFAQEAYLSLALGVAIVLLERRVAGSAKGESRFTTAMVLALAAIFCTVFGYFGLQPMMEAARAGQGNWTFGQLHGVSLAFFAAKLVAVAALAWRATASITAAEPSS
jgi:small-conductance mechanosensitive channel